jgi:hypothetical protein
MQLHPQKLSAMQHKSNHHPAQCKLDATNCAGSPTQHTWALNAAWTIMPVADGNKAFYMYSNERCAQGLLYHQLGCTHEDDQSHLVRCTFHPWTPTQQCCASTGHVPEGCACSSHNNSVWAHLQHSGAGGAPEARARAITQRMCERNVSS